MDNYTQTKPHNGAVLKCSRKEYIELDSFSTFLAEHVKKAQSNLFVYLDQLNDPQNIGSIIRSSLFLGADGLISTKLNRPQLTPAIVKVSSGATELLPLLSVKMSKTFLSDAIKYGWKVVSTGEVEVKEGNYEKCYLDKLKMNKGDNVLLVLGNEGEGFESDLMEIATHKVYIPPALDKSKVGKHPFSLVESLNVGVSAAILMTHVKMQI